MLSRKKPLRRHSRPNKRAKGWERKMLAMKAWRTAVLQRDRHRCVFCERRSELQGHHVCGRAPSIVFLPENGLTVCGDCHRQVHKSIKLHRIWWKHAFPERWEVVREALAKRGRTAA